ncbi:Uncharacterized protein Adt_12628 [Abeliophyllum distichum]|uniref:Uncharacterized protein n=1 Tax=Abeliophyllum distichum TaxID=126358 RepID=A0ABD1UR87_9LAMI
MWEIAQEAIARTRRARNVTALPAPVGDVGIESNAATNHPQQKFASATQLAALQAQVTALTALLQDQNAAVSHLPQGPNPLSVGSSLPGALPQGPSPPPIGPSPLGAPPHTPKFSAIEIPPTAAPLQAPASLAPPSAPHFYSLTSGPNPYWGQPSWMPTPTLVETPVLSLEQRLEEMMGHKISKAMSNKSSRQQSMVLEEDPFSLEVMAVPLLRDFKQPKMEKYDGSSDPVDHLRSFVDLMRLQATPDAIMCRAFQPTLRREARD